MHRTLAPSQKNLWTYQSRHQENPVNQSTGANAEESWAIISGLALYENDSWNNTRDFVSRSRNHFALDVSGTFDRRLIELVNQVTTLDGSSSAPEQTSQVKHNPLPYVRSCRGLHDTQYCMKVPEQAFVE
ncbi:hypothetical protein Tco_0883543 [Tanacetum coccineum]